MALVLLPVELILLFFITKQTTKDIFLLLTKLTHNKKLTYSVITLIYFPGTIIHELAHFFMATICFLKVTEVRIFPEFKNNYIRLGSVIYEKKDFVRGILVGAAPIIVGLIFFITISTLKLFPSENIYLNLIFGYLIFVMASTMFSSKQDLVDLVYIIPLILIIWFVIYIFNINLSFLWKYISIVNSISALNDLNLYLLISIIINLCLVIIFRSLRFILNR